MKSVDLNASNSPQQTKTQRVEPIRPKTPEPVRSKAADSAKQPPVSRTADQVSVSGTAVVERLVQRARGLDDVRQQRVDHLRRLVATDQYHVSASDIAEAILNE